MLTRNLDIEQTLQTKLSNTNYKKYK